MVARLAKAASADYYIHSQASFRPPDDYYLSGEEPDGVWFNPSALFSNGASDNDTGATVDSADFYKLYNGFHPRTGDKLTRNAGKPNRCPAYDLTFNADKTVSALWAIAPPDLRAEIENAHNDAVRVALEDTVQKHCAYTRICDKDNNITVVPADIMAAMFQHGASRANDPHLHTHCVILNVARTHHDGKWRALHGNPLFSWPKAAGAAYRAELAWLMRTRLGIEMEAYGDEHDLTRIRDIPEDLVEQWSKRGAEMHDAAARFGLTIKGNRGLNDAVLRATRSAKQHGVDPETRHANWKEEAAAHFEDLDLAIDSLTGHEFELTDEHRKEIADRIENLPAQLTDKEAVFKYTHVFEKTFNATAGLLPREERQALFEQVLASQEILELDRPGTQYDGGALLPHARTYTSAHNLRTEQRIDELSSELVVTRRFGLSDEILNQKIDALKAEDYPTSEEQIDAMRAATRPGQIAIIEGAAGSGKTTTLRPIADLYREHGHRVIATAVPWAVTLELGTDLDAPNWCVDKMIAMNATGRLTIDAKTVIFVDEAGMLASSQALKILQIARRSGAKIVFAGDTQQQQPVQAGPGLRLIRDVASSTRVDTIRRQQPDMEDILIAVHGEDPADALRRAQAATDAEKRAILDEYEAIPDNIKPAMRPWQVVASENFRDGEAAAGIVAYDLRGCFHIERDLDGTLSRLVDDWHRFQTEHPDKTSAVIANSNAEVRTLSFLIRERVLKGSEGPRYTVHACRSRKADAKPEPLEIAVGDRLRAGALNWSKKIFNGTYLTVLDLEQRAPEDAEGAAPRLWIRAKTDRGRIVEFHHDEIRDYHGKVRLDYGYAMTMTSAQGLTVDRAFVFANQKPARETIYPAFTRHRERLDIYIDRKPVELEIRQQRNEEIAGDPVTDAEIREHLARTWSRESPKEAAKDYMSDEMRERHFGHRAENIHPAAAMDRKHSRTDPEGHTAKQWLKANDAGDGKLAAVAERIHYSEIQLRNGLAAETIGRACRTLNASFERWEEKRSRAGNTVIATDPAFRKDVRESSAILRTVAPFLQGDALHARLLRERGGIHISDLRALADSHTLARSIRVMSLGERRKAGQLYNTVPTDKDPSAALLSMLDRDFDALQPEHEMASTPIHHGQDVTAGRQLELDFDAIEAPEPAHEAQFQPGPDMPLDLPPDYPPPDIAPHIPSNENYANADLDIDPDWELDPSPHFAPAPEEEIAPPDRAPAIGPEPDLEAETSPAQNRTPETTRTDDAAPKPVPVPATIQRLDAFNQDFNRHVRTAQAAGTHPVLAEGWDALRQEMRGLVNLPDLDSREREELLDLLAQTDEWLAHRSRQTGTRASRNSHGEPDLAAGAPAHTPQPAPPNRVQQHLEEIARHCDTAGADGLHPFDLAGWAELEARLRGLLDIPRLQAAERARIEREIGKIDAEHETRRAARQQTPAPAPDLRRAGPTADPDELLRDHAARVERHYKNAARHNIHPYDLPGWTYLEHQLRGFLRHPDFDESHISNVRQQLERIAATHEARRAEALAARQREEAAEREARENARLRYEQHLERHRALNAASLDPSDPTTFASRVWDELEREGLEIAELSHLPDDAQADLRQLYDRSIFRQEPELTQQRAAPSDAARQSRTAEQGDSYARIVADIRQHRADAARVGRHPYMAPGWDRIVERCHDLIVSGELTPKQETGLRGLLEHHREWKAQRNEITLPFEHGRGKSRGMSF